MQWARGFFRLWLVLTALLIVLVGYSYNVLNAVQVLVWQDFRPSLCSDPSVLKALEGWKVSRTEGVAESAGKFEADCIIYGESAQLAQVTVKIGRDWEEYLANESDEAIAAMIASAANSAALKFNSNLKSKKEKAAKNFQEFLNYSIVPALWLLVLGAGLTWALRGFKARKG